MCTRSPQRRSLARLSGSDLAALRTRLATLLVVQQLTNNARQVMIPWLRGNWGTALRLADNQAGGAQPLAASAAAAADGAEAEAEPSTPAGEGSGCDKRLQQALVRLRQRPEYVDTYEDYLEMFTQFGQVTMFASAFPVRMHCRSAMAASARSRRLAAGSAVRCGEQCGACAACRCAVAGPHVQSHAQVALCGARRWRCGRMH